MRLSDISGELFEKAKKEIVLARLRHVKDNSEHKKVNNHLSIPELKGLSAPALLLLCVKSFFGDQWNVLKVIDNELYKEYDHQQLDLRLSFMGGKRLCSNGMITNAEQKCTYPFEANLDFWGLAHKDNPGSYNVYKTHEKE